MAGLSAAWHLRHRNILLLEANDRVGGRLRSEARGSYWLNFGAHLFGEPDSPAGRLVSDLGLETRRITGHRLGIAYRGKIVAGGAMEMYPLRLPLSLAGRISFARMGLKLRAGVNRLLEFQRHLPEEDYSERVRRLLGFENNVTFSKFTGPLHAEVDEILRTILERTGSSPEGMSAGYGLSSFSTVWTPHFLGRNLVGGSARLPQAMATQLGERIHLDAAVYSIRITGNLVEVQWREAGEDRRAFARYVVVATQADVASAIVDDLPSDTAQALRQIRYGPFLSMAVLTSETGPMPWDGNYAIATPGMSFGVFFNQAITLRSGARQPGGSLMLFRGADGAAEMMAKSDRDIERSFLADLHRLYPETRGIVAETKIQRWPQGAPFAFDGRAELQPALTQPLGRIFLAGDYLEAPNMDAAIRAGFKAAAEIRQRLDHDTETMSEQPHIA